MVISRAHSLVGYKPEGRPVGDFYPTPVEAIQALIDTQYIPYQPIWEPACGNGVISEVLISNGWDDVFSTDLYDRGYGEPNVDFLRTTYLRPGSTIITNPPFSLASEFLVHAKKLGASHIFLLAKLAFLEGVDRSKLLEETKLSRVLVFRRRLTMTRNGEKMKNGGMIAFAWFCWLPDHPILPTIQWI